MKFGQALSVFEAAIPEQLAAPYREALTKLQSAAPPMSPQSVRRVLDEQLGTGWRRRFADFSDEPAAAASIGQVHRAVWHDGREVAVKVQYPGADEALRSDLRQLQRFSRLFQAIVPGMEVKPLLTELRDRMVEELDYRDEANNQRVFARAFRDHPDIAVPTIVASAPKVIVSQWISGVPMAKIIRSGSRAERDDIGTKLSLFHSCSPALTGLLHADPHPGNFLRLEDGRLGVLDFGASAKLPGGTPRTLGVATRLAVEERSAELLELLRSEGFVRPGMQLRAEDVLAYLSPFADPVRTETFHFTRAWMQEQAERVGDFSGPDFRTGRALNLPPSYLLIHRVSTGTFGVLCQLDATVPLRAITERWQPGFAD
jgi:predicted unusual protein kinase regulating ubiquinone biosynthesis (AarF/ABC1/UbiB family)